MIVFTIHISFIYITDKRFSFYMTYEQFLDLSIRYAINKNCKPLGKIKCNDIDKL